VPEGVAAAGRVTGEGVHDDPDSPPPPGPDATKGWAWNRKSRSWAPRQRGPVLWEPEPVTQARAARDAADEARAGQIADDLNRDAQRDPDPSYLTGDSQGTGGGRVKFEDVPQQVKDDIAGLAGLVGTPVLAVLRSMDPYCGTVLAENFGPVVDATLPLICRSSKIVRYFTEDKADWLLWGKLAMALAPVARAVAEHHIFKTVEVVKDPKTGQVTIARGKQQGEHDHLQPKVPGAAQYAA